MGKQGQEEINIMKFNPRYVAYAKAHGRSPQAMLEHDDIQWPGGIMCGFILWVHEMKKKFLKSDPSHCCLQCLDMRDKFTRFLRQ